MNVFVRGGVREPEFFLTFRTFAEVIGWGVDVVRVGVLRGVW